MRKLLLYLPMSVIAAYVVYHYDLMQGFFDNGEERSFMPGGVLLIAFIAGGSLLFDRLNSLIWPDRRPQPPAAGPPVIVVSQPPPQTTSAAPDDPER